MAHRKQVINLQLNQVMDALLLTVVLWLCHALRYYSAAYLDFIPTRIPPFAYFTWLIMILVPFGPLVLESQGFYETKSQKTPAKSIGQIFRAGAILFLIIAGCSIFLRLGIPGRSVLVLFAIFGSLALYAKDRLVVARLRARAKGGDIKENVVVVGAVEERKALLGSLGEDAAAEIEVVGELDLEHQPFSQLVAMLHAHSVGRVIVAGSQSHLGVIQETIATCEVEGVEVWLVADFFRTSIARPSFGFLSEQPMLIFRSAPDYSWQMLLKGFIDRLGALAGLILLLPLFLFVAIVIRRTSPGPVFFRQQRAGRHGRPFTMYKFRTMYVDAEQRREELESLNQMSGPVFKIQNDPRITPPGRFLRKTSIDEFPQLWNVLMGDMSLVGPRPLPMYEVAKFEDRAQRRRLSVRPGLTCLWQISGRNTVKDFQDWVRLDLEYIDNWSLALDLKILIKTVPVVLCGAGAH